MAPTIGNSTSANTTASGSTLNFSHNSNSNLLYVVIAAFDEGADATETVTFNSVSLTNLSQAGGAGTHRIKLWVFRLVSPSGGSQTVAIDIINSAQRIFATAFNVIDADVATLEQELANSQGSGSSRSRAVASAEGELVIDVAPVFNAGVVTEGAGQTVIDEHQHSWSFSSWLVTSTEPGATSVTMSYSWNNVTNNCYATWALEPAPPVIGGAKRAAMFFSLAGLAIPAAMSKIIVPSAELVEKLIGSSHKLIREKYYGRDSRCLWELE